MNPVRCEPVRVTGAQPVPVENDHLTGVLLRGRADQARHIGVVAMTRRDHREHPIGPDDRQQLIDLPDGNGTVRAERNHHQDWEAVCATLEPHDPLRHRPADHRVDLKPVVRQRVGRVVQDRVSDGERRRADTERPSRTDIRRLPALGIRLRNTEVKNRDECRGYR